jgi:hypothetical protein
MDAMDKTHSRNRVDGAQGVEEIGRVQGDADPRRVLWRCGSYEIVGDPDAVATARRMIDRLRPGGFLGGEGAGGVVAQAQRGPEGLQLPPVPYAFGLATALSSK